MRPVHAGRIYTRDPPSALAYPLDVTELTATATAAATVCHLNPPESAGRLRSRALLKVTITTSRRHRATIRPCKSATRKSFRRVSGDSLQAYIYIYMYIVPIICVYYYYYYFTFIYVCVCMCVRVCYRIPTPIPSHRPIART